MDSQATCKASNKGKTIVVIAIGNVNIRLLGYIARNDCYRFLQSRDSPRCLKLLQGVLDVDDAWLESRNVRCLLPRT